MLSINGTALQNSAHWEALHTLRKARGQGMVVVVLQTVTAERSPLKDQESQVRNGQMSKSRGSKGKHFLILYIHMHVVVVIIIVKAFGNQSTLVLSYLIIILIALPCIQVR